MRRERLLLLVVGTALIFTGFVRREQFGNDTEVAILITTGILVHIVRWLTYLKYFNNDKADTPRI